MSRSRWTRRVQTKDASWVPERLKINLRETSSRPKITPVHGNSGVLRIDALNDIVRDGGGARRPHRDDVECARPCRCAHSPRWIAITWLGRICDGHSKGTGSEEVRSVQTEARSRGSGTRRGRGRGGCRKREEDFDLTGGGIFRPCAAR